MNRKKGHDATPQPELDAAHRTFLPLNLAASLRYLPDQDILRLAAAVAVEMDHRKLATPEAVSQSSPTTVADPVLSRLTRAQISLIRSSIRAGVKPAALSSQFGLTRAEIAAALKAQD
jgi:hypothetical protein